MADTPTFATVRDLIEFTLRVCGITGLGQTPIAQQTNDAHRFLRAMMKNWRENRWLIFRLVDNSFVGTGAQTYTIGPTGGIIVDVRPARIEQNPYYVQLAPAGNTQVSFPLMLLQSRQDYNLICLKNMGTVPAALFYDPTLPNGTLYPWPLPNSSYRIHFLTKQILDGLNDLNQSLVGLPGEFEEALWSNLAIRCAAMKGGTGMALAQDVHMIAASSLETIKSANYNIATLKMPPAVTKLGPGYGFNIYTGW